MPYWVSTMIHLTHEIARNRRGDREQQTKDQTEFCALKFEQNKGETGV